MRDGVREEGTTASEGLDFGVGVGPPEPEEEEDDDEEEEGSGWLFEGLSVGVSVWLVCSWASPSVLILFEGGARTSLVCSDSRSFLFSPTSGSIFCEPFEFCFFLFFFSFLTFGFGWG